MARILVSLPPIDVQLSIVDVLAVLEWKAYVHEQISRVTEDMRNTALAFLLAGAGLPPRPQSPAEPGR
jgi:hypothetical protein